MGRRWRSKRKNTARKGGWDDIERSNLLRYLKTYRTLALAANKGDQRSAKFKSSFTSRIGNINMPDLSLSEVVSLPFLQLPIELSSKQRKVVHEMCVEVNLYHASVGEDRDSRFVAVSVFSDGFTDLPGLEKPFRFPIHHFKPWYCKELDYTKPWKTLVSSGVPASRQQAELESSARKEIDKLIDQPGECLRDDLDTMDFSEWIGKDLSDIPVPEAESINLVDTPDKMKHCLDSLLSNPPTALAFDLEMHNPSKFAQLTCLLQLATDNGQEFVIDTLAPGVFEMVGQLGPLFLNPRIIKIGHAIGGLDIRSLHRDFGIFVVNAFDTFEAAKVLGLKSLGLASLCAYYGFAEPDVYSELKAEYQTCDWRVRPLTPPMIQYGRFDVYFLIKLRMLMIRDLTRKNLFDQLPEEHLQEAAMVADAFAAFNAMEDEEYGVETFEKVKLSSESTTKDIALASDTTSVGDFQSVGSFNSNEFFTPTTSRQQSMIHDSEEGSTSEKDSQHNNITPASASILRLEPSLMKALSTAQQRCKNLWSSRKEPVEKNPFLVTLLQRTKRNELAIPFLAENLVLYHALSDWRESVASRLECLPAFVAPLDVLVQVAWQKPATEASLRRITMYLPEVMLECPELVDEFLAIIVKSLGKEETTSSSSDETHLYYTSKNFSRNASDHTDRDNEGIGWRKFAGAAVVAMGAAVAFAVISSRKRKR